MLKVSLVALLVAVAAAPKKKRAPPPAAPVPTRAEPAPAADPAPAPIAEPEPVKAPEPVKPEPEPVQPEPAKAAPAAQAQASEPGELKPASAVETTKPRLVVLEVTPGGGIDPTVANALGDAITLEVQKRGYFTATSMKELQTMLGVERQRQLMGCAEGASACMAELADAIGARFVLSGSLTRLGDAYQLSLQTIDTTKAQPIGRTVRIAKDPAALIDQVPYAVAEATATTLPPPPSRVLPYSLIIGGGVLVLGGGVIALGALTRERAIEGELDASTLNPGVLRTLSSYQSDSFDIRVQKSVALAAVVLGGALLGLGIFLMPPSTPGGAQVAVVPSGNGASLVGVFP